MGHEVTGQVQNDDSGTSPTPTQRQTWHAPVLEEFVASRAGAKTRAGAIDGAGGALRYS